MKENVEDLKSVYALSDRQYNDILEMIIMNATYNKFPVRKPKNIVIAGQPGSGKSVIRRQALLESQQNAVVCDVDNYRDYHPLAKEIKKYHEPLYGEITNEYARNWNRDLCRFCRRNGLNYILETTFKDGDCQNDTMRAVREFGYNIEIKLLAVHPKISLLGVYQRYEEAKKIRGNGRMVPPDYHDTCYQALQYSIPKVQKARLYNDLNIYSRSTVIEQNSLEKGVTVIAHNPRDPFQVHQKEVSKLWPEELWDFGKEKYNRVIELMERRNAPVQEIIAFKRNVAFEPDYDRQLVKRNSQKI